MNETISAPWTAEQVDALNHYQSHGATNPLTCGNHTLHGDANVVLIARVDGLRCSDPACGYWQRWAYAFMADPKWSARCSGEPAS